jgi:hypothetical protein
MDLTFPEIVNLHRSGKLERPAARSLFLSQIEKRRLAIMKRLIRNNPWVAEFVSSYTSLRNLAKNDAVWNEPKKLDPLLTRLNILDQVVQIPRDRKVRYAPHPHFTRCVSCQRAALNDFELRNLPRHVFDGHGSLYQALELPTKG